MENFDLLLESAQANDVAPLLNLDEEVDPFDIILHLAVKGPLLSLN